MCNNFEPSRSIEFPVPSIASSVVCIFTMCKCEVQMSSRSCSSTDSEVYPDPDPNFSRVDIEHLSGGVEGSKQPLH